MLRDTRDFQSCPKEKENPGRLYFSWSKDVCSSAPEVVRACASRAGRGFAPLPRHTKCDKNGTGSSHAGVSVRKIQEGR